MKETSSPRKLIEENNTILKGVDARLKRLRECRLNGKVQVVKNSERLMLKKKMTMTRISLGIDEIPWQSSF